MNDKKSNSIIQPASNRKLLKYKSQIEKYNDKIDELEDKIEDLHNNVVEIPTIKPQNKPVQNVQNISISSITNQKPEIAKPDVSDDLLLRIDQAAKQIEKSKEAKIKEANQKAEQERLLNINEAQTLAEQQLKAITEASIKNSIGEVKPLASISNKKDLNVKNQLPDKKKIVNEINNPVLEKMNKTKAIGKKKTFSYKVKREDGHIIKATCEAYSKEDVLKFLTNSNYKVLSLTEVKGMNINLSIFDDKMKNSELAFLLTQLSTYLKAGISLIDSVKILEKQATKSSRKKIYFGIIDDLSRGESFSQALENQGKVFPKLLTNMIRAAELTGDLPSVLDDMSSYYDTIDRTKKQTVSALMYPLIIFIFSIIVVSFVLIYVVPKFVNMFNQAGAEVPTITKIIVAVSSFMAQNFIYLVLGIFVVLLIYILLFKKVKSFRRMMQTFLMHIPVIKDIIIYKELTMFTKTFASLLNHNVFITQSMEILSTISDNEVYKKIINKCLTSLSKGGKISEAFKGEWAFPIVAYEMLVTGENTGQLGKMMQYVADYYQDLHANLSKRLNTFIEPIMIIFLAVSVGIIMLAIVSPMFSYYSQMSG